MITVETILRDNDIVRRLIEGGAITPGHLKKIYRALCKTTHPDVRPQDGQEFIRLRREYEEALAHWDEIRSRLVGETGGDRIDPAEVRRRFYEALRHYLAAGLCSQRVRLRPDIRQRNDRILREVLAWANLYRPDFIPLFLDYNKTQVRRYLEWRKRDNLSKAGKIFIMGFNNLVDFRMGHSPQSRRTAWSFFTETLNVLSTVSPSAAAQSIERLTRWFLEELAGTGVPPGKENS